MSSQALTLNPILPPPQILSQLRSGQLLRIEGKSGTALLICHRHHTEIAGPGAAVGGLLDLNCRRVIPVGKVALLGTESHEERKKAFVLRQRWIQKTHQVASFPVPLKRAKTILMMLERYCGSEATTELPDDVLGQLVGVLPKTMAVARQVRPELQSPPTEVRSCTVRLEKSAQDRPIRATSS
ncbi:MAG: hypothetical protein SW833_10200 [Cyanobacteriota bacterium]|nr:hypothetical protein [Cyanobacteriota bacterium]